MNKIQPAIVTNASGPVTVGDKIHDVGTLTNTFGTPDKSLVTFEVFKDAACTKPAFASPGTPNAPTAHGGGGFDYTSADVTTDAAGTYYWIAHFAGDASNKSADTACGDPNESSTVNKIQPAIVTNASGPITLGGKIHDVATLTNTFGTPDKSTVTFEVFKDAACTKPAFASPGTPSAPTAHGGGGFDYTSADVTPNAAGTYYWIAHFAGDANNKAADTKCGDDHESSLVNKATPALTTTASGSVGIGNAIHDTAHLTGGFPVLVGTITFQVFAPGDVQCITPLTPAPASATVAGANDYASGNFTANTAGTYRWIAHYSGDANNNAVDTHCNDAGESVLVINPKISIVKTTSTPVVVSGGTATFQIVVTNNGDATLTNVSVSDALAPGCAMTAAQIATIAPHSSSTFAPGDMVTYPCTQANVTANETNSATATGTPPVGPNVTATSTADVAVIHPAIKVTKGPASQTITSGDTATFTITVINSGDATLTNVNVTDALAPGCARTAAQIATIAPHSSSTFAPGDTVSYTCTQANVTANETNSATATGTPIVGPDVTSTATADVIVTTPPSSSSPSPSASIGITKNPKSQTITQGGSATFAIVVTNTGGVTLTNVHTTDALSPDCARSLGTLAPGASTSFTCTLGNVQANLTNVAVSTGTRQDTGTDVTANDSAPVTVTAPFVPPAVVVTTHPAISIVKDPSSQSVAFDGTATFTITVKNTGDVTLTNVTVTDPLSPDCDRDLGTLAKGASKSYSCKRANVKDGFTNVATATGKPPTGANVTAKDSATVTAKAAPFTPPSRPAIAIVKTTSTPTVLNGKTATFKITVTNTGNTELKNVTVTDPLSPNCDNSIGTLAAGASSSYSCTRPNLKNSFTNVATATGKPPTGPNVKATASVPVKVMQPAPQVVAHIKPKATG